MTYELPIPNSDQSVSIDLPENLSSLLRELFIPTRKEGE